MRPASGCHGPLHHSRFGSNIPVGTAALARVELGPEELPRFLAGSHHAEVVTRLQEIGYLHVTLDLAGYRRGSTNGVPRRTVSPIEMRARKVPATQREGA